MMNQRANVRVCSSVCVCCFWVGGCVVDDSCPRVLRKESAARGLLPLRQQSGVPPHPLRLPSPSLPPGVAPIIFKTSFGQRKVRARDVSSFCIGDEEVPSPRPHWHAPHTHAHTHAHHDRDHVTGPRTSTGHVYHLRWAPRCLASESNPLTDSVAERCA